MQSKKGNLNLFSEGLTLELKSILKSLYGIEQSDTDVQEIGRRIAQFVFSQETAGPFDTNAKRCSIGEERTRWV